MPAICATLRNPTTELKNRLLPILMMLFCRPPTVFIRYSQTYVSLFAVIAILAASSEVSSPEEDILTGANLPFGLMYANSMTSDLVDETLIIVAAPTLVLFWRKSFRANPQIANCLSCS